MKLVYSHLNKSLSSPIDTGYDCGKLASLQSDTVNGHEGGLYSFTGLPTILVSKALREPPKGTDTIGRRSQG